MANFIKVTVAEVKNDRHSPDYGAVKAITNRAWSLQLNAAAHKASLPPIPPHRLSRQQHSLRGQKHIFYAHQPPIHKTVVRRDINNLMPAPRNGDHQIG